MTGRVIQTEEIIFRPFQARNFGIYNSDCTNNCIYCTELIAIYKNDKNEIIQPHKVILIEKNNKVIYSFLSQSISFNPNIENTIIVIGKDNSISWCHTNSVLKRKNGDTYEFVLKSMMKESYTPEDINKMITF
jgi:hypothetical protein